jgi:hypothetical protein
MTTIASITAAEQGWKAIFAGGPENDESQSRIIAWGVTQAGETVGLIVHPEDRRTIAAATDVTLADGSTFDRYAYRGPT